MATQFTRELTTVYKASKASNGTLAKVIEDEVATKLPTTSDAPSMYDQLRSIFGDDVDGFNVCAADCVNRIDTELQAKVSTGATPRQAWDSFKNAYRACEKVGTAPGMVSIQAVGDGTRECTAFIGVPGGIAQRFVKASDLGAELANRSYSLQQQLKTYVRGTPNSGIPDAIFGNLTIGSGRLINGRIVVSVCCTSNDNLITKLAEFAGVPKSEVLVGTNTSTHAERLIFDN